MADGWGTRAERGVASVSVVATLVVVILAGALVYRVAWTAESINNHAGRIAETAVPINEATDAVLDLDTTNELASSINETAKPLQGKLAEIVRLAQSVDGLAKSIAGTAADVDGTASGINEAAAGIVDVARSIDRGLVQINANLDETIAIAERIKADTGNILGQARDAHRRAACIDRGLGGSSDGHCG